jgi:type IV pilus assembly protein PilM
MLGYVLGKRRWPIALDIGTESIRMLQMRPAGGGLAVRACGRRRLPASSPREGQAWRQLVTDAARELLREGDFRGRRVASALSCNDLKIKNVRLPNLSADKLDEAVRWEAKERFGCDLAPDQLYYLRAGQVRQGTDPTQEIILVAAPGEVVDAHLSLLADIGLRPEHIEAEPVALFRPFERMLRRRADEGAVTVVVDLGYSATRVVVARGRQIVLIKAIGIGGRRFTEAVAKQLNIPFEEARELREQIAREQGSDRARGGSADGQGEPNSVSWTILDALRGDVEELAREIALCLRYCSVTFRGLRPKQVTIAGGQARDRAMVRLLSEQLGVECLLGQPLKGIDTSGVDFESDRRGMLAEWNVCVGLALRSAEPETESPRSSHGSHRLSA